MPLTNVRTTIIGERYWFRNLPQRGIMVNDLISSSHEQTNKRKITKPFSETYSLSKRHFVGPIRPIQKLNNEKKTSVGFI